MRPHLLLPFALVGAGLLAAPASAAPIGVEQLLLNANDFNGQSFVHVDFETASGQNTLVGINSFLAGQPFGAVASLPVSFLPSTSTMGAGGGFDGGAVSGVNHLVGNNGVMLSLTFSTPVQAAGFFLGGTYLASGSNSLTITLDGGAMRTISSSEWSAAGVPDVENAFSSANAINGFIGVHANGGPGIIALAWYAGGDQESIDDVFFGDAVFSGTLGPTAFPENATIGTSSIPLPAAGSGVPEPASLSLLLAAGAMMMLRRPGSRS
jgi:hypothetical protein